MHSWRVLQFEDEDVSCDLHDVENKKQLKFHCSSDDLKEGTQKHRKRTDSVSDDISGLANKNELNQSPANVGNQLVHQSSFVVGTISLVPYNPIGQNDVETCENHRN